jgi:hypothetical protein
MHCRSLAPRGRTCAVKWVSADSVCGPCYCGTALHLMKDLVETCGIAGTDLSARLLSSGYIDLMTSALLAVEQVGSEKASCWPVVYSLWLLSGLDGEALPEIEAKVAQSLGPALRYMVEHEVTIFSAMGWSTKTFGASVLANIWGKQEEAESSSGYELTQTDVNDLLVWSAELVRPTTALGATWSLSPNQGRGLKHICISDRHKELALGSAGFVSHLLDGLFLEERNPRPEISTAVKEAIQKDFADSILQLAVYPRGCAALRAEPDVEAAVRALAADGSLSEEAKGSAERILHIILENPDSAASGRSVRNVDDPDRGSSSRHCMMSYAWEQQAIVMRIVAELKRRDYEVWVDVDCMRGSIMDSTYSAQYWCISLRI